MRVRVAERDRKAGQRKEIEKKMFGRGRARLSVHRKVEKTKIFVTQSVFKIF